MIKISIFGFKTEIHFSFFLLIALGVYYGSGLFVAFSAVFSFLHEIVHGTVAKFLGYSPEKISFGLFGGVIHVREGFLNPKDELTIYLSGPLFNLINATVFYVILIFQEQIINKLNFINFEFFEVIIWPMLLSNLILGCFNLLPFYPLDGGKVVNIYLAFFLGYGRAEKISYGLSMLFSLMLFILGIFLSKYNLMNLTISALALNLFIVSKQTKSFIFYKVSKDIENNFDCKSKFKKNFRQNSKEIVVYREKQKAMKVIDSYKPWDNNIFTIVSDVGAYKGQLTEEELLKGIYECGIYADFGKLLMYKKNVP